MRNLKFFCLLFFSFTCLAQQDHLDLEEHFKEIPASDLLILGTFHFKDAGADSYKPKNTVDILSPERQKELEKVLDNLKEYGPTKIAVEVKKSGQDRLDSLYTAYLNGKFQLPENELYQIGFRLGRLLGHDRIYAVDAESRRYTPGLSEAEHAEKQQYFIEKADQSLLQREMKLEELYNELYSKKDDLKMQVSLLDYLLFLNSPELVETGHGHYSIGSFKMGEGEDYYGPDGATAWYNRNLRIFHNLLQITDPGKDRIFMLIGAGHLPILNLLAESSPDFDKIEFAELVEE